MTRVARGGERKDPDSKSHTSESWVEEGLRGSGTWWMYAVGLGRGATRWEGEEGSEGGTEEVEARREEAERPTRFGWVRGRFARC